MTEKKLSIISPNKTVVFYSPMDGNDVLVRTGTLESRDSILHALSHAYSRDYVSMDFRKREKFVHKLKKNFKKSSSKTVLDLKKAKSILKDFWESIPENKKCSLRETRKIIGTVINNKADEEVYKILCELLSLEDLKKIFDENKERQKIVVDKLNSIGNKDSKYEVFCCQKFDSLIENILKESNRLKTPKNVTIKHVSEDNLNVLQDTLDRDIYVFDSNKRMPVNQTEPKNKKSIILLRTKNDHYEVIGRLLAGDRVQREFAPDDPLILRIKSIAPKENKKEESESEDEDESEDESEESEDESEDEEDEESEDKESEEDEDESEDEDENESEDEDEESEDESEKEESESEDDKDENKDEKKEKKDENKDEKEKKKNEKEKHRQGRHSHRHREDSHRQDRQDRHRRSRKDRKDRHRKDRKDRKDHKDRKDKN